MLSSTKPVEGWNLELLDQVKAWMLGIIIGPVLTLLLFFFRRSTTQIDEKLKALDADLEEVREVLASKVERNDLNPVWEAIRVHDQDIKNLGSAFSRELREQIDNLRREQNEQQRQTHDRLDRILSLIAQGQGRSQ